MLIPIRENPFSRNKLRMKNKIFIFMNFEVSTPEIYKNQTLFPYLKFVPLKLQKFFSFMGTNMAVYFSWIPH